MQKQLQAAGIDFNLAELKLPASASESVLAVDRYGTGLRLGTIVLGETCYSAALRSEVSLNGSPRLGFYLQAVGEDRSLLDPRGYQLSIELGGRDGWLDPKTVGDLKQWEDGPLKHASDHQLKRLRTVIREALRGLGRVRDHGPANPAPLPESAPVTDEREIGRELLLNRAAVVRADDGRLFCATCLLSRTSHALLARISLYSAGGPAALVDIGLHESPFSQKAAFMTHGHIQKFQDLVADDPSLIPTAFFAAISVKEGYSRCYSGIGKTLLGLACRVSKTLGAEFLYVQHAREQSKGFFEQYAHAVEFLPSVASESPQARTYVFRLDLPESLPEVKISACFNAGNHPHQVHARLIDCGLHVVDGIPRRAVLAPARSHLPHPQSAAYNLFLSPDADAADLLRIVDPDTFLAMIVVSPSCNAANTPEFHVYGVEGEAPKAASEFTIESWENLLDAAKKRILG